MKKSTVAEIRSKHQSFIYKSSAGALKITDLFHRLKITTMVSDNAEHLMKTRSANRHNQCSGLMPPSKCRNNSDYGLIFHEFTPDFF